MEAVDYLFIAEYARDFNPTKAAIRAGVPVRIARRWAEEKMSDIQVKSEIELTIRSITLQVGVEVADVLRDIVSVLRADPRELIDLVRTCCRHCWGDNFRYQRTPEEMRKHVDFLRGQLKPVDYEGGAGFNANDDPNPDCPECHGNGLETVRVKDTRDLSPDALALYEGVKQTKTGIEVGMRSKDAARAAAALFLGMNKQTIINDKKVAEMTDDELLAIAQGKK